MGKEYESMFQNGYLFITHKDGTRTKIGEVKGINVSIDKGNEKDQTAIHTFTSFEGSFDFKKIKMSNDFKLLIGDKSYLKYLKRVKNRNKLYNKLKKKGRKL